uniref:Uncharacterized protein n=1 Tax=Arundo donax TaxID=35708 RepID=A0A0A9B0F0_ARUDO
MFCAAAVLYEFDLIPRVVNNKCQCSSENSFHVRTENFAQLGSSIISEKKCAIHA